MSGRDYIQGEKGPYLGTRDHQRYLSRIVRGQISGITPKDGKVQVEGLDRVFSESITISPLWFSAKAINPKDINSQAKTAWGRYMPLGSELVEVGYRNDDTAYIIGYNITATNKDDKAGYDILVTARDEHKATGFQSFRDLRPGEFDFKSVGNAYIHGSAFGTLLLAGGQAFIKLDNQAYRIDCKASEQRFTSGSSELRMGTVFRKLKANDTVESPVNNAGSVYKEFLLDLNHQTALGTASTQSKAKIHLGDVLDNTTLLPKKSASNENVRGIISIGDSNNLVEAFGLEIDVLGNIVWNQNATGTNGLNMSANQFIINATGQSGGTGGIMKLDSGNINLGALNAANKAVLWKPGLYEELTSIKEDIANLANDIKAHGHALPYQSLGIPTGEIIQVIKTTFAGGKDAGFTVVTPPNKFLSEAKPGSGPMTTVSGAGETNILDSEKPRNAGGFFRSDYSVGDPSSSIVNIEK